MAGHAMVSVGCLRPDAAAQPRSTSPAGTSRQAATSRGVVCGARPFITTMDVPQKKKGDTRMRPSRAPARGPVRWGGGCWLVPPAVAAGPLPTRRHMGALSLTLVALAGPAAGADDRRVPRLAGRRVREDALDLLAGAIAGQLGRVWRRGQDLGRARCGLIGGTGL